MEEWTEMKPPKAGTYVGTGVRALQLSPTSVVWEMKVEGYPVARHTPLDGSGVSWYQEMLDAFRLRTLSAHETLLDGKQIYVILGSKGFVKRCFAKDWV